MWVSPTISVAICRTVIPAILALHLASCASNPAASDVPVVEAGMPAQRTTAVSPREAPLQTQPGSPEPVATAGFGSEQAQYPGDPSTPLTEPQPTGVAVLALLETADLQRADGQLAAAAASLERALRIEPQNPWTWYRLAAVRLQQDRLDQAEQLARRADSLAGTDNEVRSSAWRLIAQIRERRGDRAGARQARQQADTFEP